MKKWEPSERCLDRLEIESVSLAYFSTCNIRCNYCFTVQLNDDQLTPLGRAPRLYNILRKLFEEGHFEANPEILFAGGEPTLTPEFERLLNLFSEHGCRVSIITNAVKRSQAIVDSLKRGNLKVVMGIDAATADVYKAIKKMNYNEAVWTNAAEYAAAGEADASNAVWGKFIVLVENFHETEQFIERAEAAGIRHVYFDVDVTRAESRVTPWRAARGEIGMPEEIAEKIALFIYEGLNRSMEVDFMSCGLTWFTPERKARIVAEFLRLEAERGRISPENWRYGQLVREMFDLPERPVPGIAASAVPDAVVADGAMRRALRGIRRLVAG
jgi:sulfatase maturation enzyme AslB (radical SAM superfamily)